MGEKTRTFSMPRYKEIPDIGLYLEQTVKYVNTSLAPFRTAITPSMLSNYVKQGYLERPVKKQYYAEQIAHLLFIALAKQVLSMDSIKKLIALRERTCTAEAAYEFFRCELEDVLEDLLRGKSEQLTVDKDATPERELLRSLVIALAHICYLQRCMEEIPDTDA